MKLHKNNRKSKVELSARVAKENNLSNPLLEKKECQEFLINLVTVEICKTKSQKSGSFLPLNRSRHNYSILIDSYERALASVNMYLHSQNIKNDIGYLYLVSCDSFPGYLKIGCTKDCERRIHVYQICSPFRDYNLERYMIVDNYKEVEKIVLENLKCYVINGEWIEKFKEISEITVYIAEILGYNGTYTRFTKAYRESFFDKIGL